MSISAMSALLESGMESGGRYMVLQALAYHLRVPEPGDPASLQVNEVKISRATISAHARLGDRQVARILKELREAKPALIEIVGKGGSGPGDANVYALHFLDVCETAAFAAKKARRVVFAGFAKAVAEADLIGCACNPKNAARLAELAAETVASEGHDRVAAQIRAAADPPHAPPEHPDAEKGCQNVTLIDGESDPEKGCHDVTHDAGSSMTSETAKGDISCKNPFIQDSKGSPDSVLPCAREPANEIFDKLIEAAGLTRDEAMASPGLVSPVEIIHLIAPTTGPPCDLTLDVLPAVQTIAARRRAQNAAPITNWSYYRAAIIQNRDRRLAGNPAPDPAATARSVPARPGGQPGGSSLVAVAMRMSRELRDAEQVPGERGGEFCQDDHGGEPGT